MIHAWWITPIWSRLFGGLPFTVAGALAVGWAYAEFRAAARFPRPAALAGLLFGLGAWVALLPATAVSTVFRITGFHQSHDSWSAAGELGVTVCAGFFIGRWLSSRARPIVACVLAAVVLLAVQAGPVAIANGRRPVGLFLLLAGLYALCGLTQALVTSWLEHRYPKPPNVAAT